MQPSYYAGKRILSQSLQAVCGLVGEKGTHISTQHIQYSRKGLRILGNVSVSRNDCSAI